MARILDFNSAKQRKATAESADDLTGEFATLREALRTDSLSLCLRWLKQNNPGVFTDEFINKMLAEIDRTRNMNSE